METVEHLTVAPEVLEEMKIPIFHVERGGDITYHGPGQVGVYPILNLKEYGYRVIRYIDQLEEVVLRVIRDFGIEGKRDPLNRGIWVERGEDCLGWSGNQTMGIIPMVLHSTTKQT